VKYTRDIRALRLYMLTLQAVSLLIIIFGILAISLYIDPALIGTPLRQHRHYRGESIWLIFGISFVLFGSFCIIVGTKWSHRLLWIWKNVSPQQMQLSIRIRKSSDSTDYQAILNTNSNLATAWRVTLYSPSWKVEDLQGTTASAKVYFDPKSQRPAVIETEWGLLWAMAGR
jgi:uncharacterized membrane protein